MRRKKSTAAPAKAKPSKPEGLEKSFRGSDPAIKGEERSPNSKVWTRADTREQTDEIDRLLTIGHDDKAIIREMKKRFGIGVARTKRIIKAVFEEWHRADSESRRYARAKQVKALWGIVAVTKNGTKKEVPIVKRDPKTKQKVEVGRKLVWDMRPNPSAAVRALELLSRIEGTQAPVQVSVNIEVSDALTGVLANLSSEQVQEALQAYRENAALAEAARQAGLLPQSSSTEHAAE